MKLTDNTILITGGSAGIGLAFAKAFIEQGNTVIVTGRNQSKLDAAKVGVSGLHTLQSDASDPEAIEQLANTVKEQFPKLNVLMNNAGVFEFKNLTTPSADLARLTHELDTNLAGPIRTTSALIDILTRNKGTIINVSSGLAFVPLQCAPIYCASKAAMHSYSIALRQQLASSGVEVIELMPPAVKTDMTSELPEDGDFKMMSTDDLVAAALKGLKSGRDEIRPGQSNQLHWMSRIAPGFINAQVAKGSAAMVPEPEPTL